MKLPSAAQQRLWVKRAKPVVFVLCSLPLTFLGYDVFTGNISADPIEDFTRVTGIWGLRLLIITLAITPLRILTGFNALIQWRRMLGVFSFVYILLHLATYVVLDQFFNFSQIVEDVIERYYILFGMLAFLLMIPLAATSWNRMIKLIGGKRWTQLHRLVYIIAPLGILHFFLQVKADITSPVLHGAVLAVLLGFRIVHHRRKQRARATSS